MVKAQGRKHKDQDLPDIIKIRTDYTETPWIKAGKVYDAVREKSGKYQNCFKVMGELGTYFYTRIHGSCHINTKDWEVVE